VQACTAGHERDLRLVPHVATGLGTQFTIYSTPASLQAAYGNYPVGNLIFVRFRPFGNRKSLIDDTPDFGRIGRTPAHDDDLW